VAVFRRILVPVAEDGADAGLLCYASMLVRVLGGPEARFVHVTREGADDGPPAGIEGRISTDFPGSRYDRAAGDVLDGILACAESSGADLILVGHASQRRRRSLARRLAAKSPCSVWMVPGGAPAAIRRILVPIDFGRRSADTVAVACAVAEGAGLDECLAAHVHFNDAAAAFDEFEEILAEDRDRAFGIFVAPIDLRGVWVKPMFVDSCHVADSILRAAREHGCDLIVMGTRGRSRSAAVLLGSETEHCMMNTGIPLLAVKHFGARLSLMGALRDDRVRKRGGERFT
jgi:nucleotide-binding universal stress UspA family protein